MITKLTSKLLQKLKRKGYRDSYVAEHVRTGIAYQIRAMREQRGMAQKELATLADKPQSVISRIENPDYGKTTISSLLDVASALDVALLVHFVDFPEFIRKMQHISPQDFEVKSFDPSEFDTKEKNEYNIIFEKASTGEILSAGIPDKYITPSTNNNTTNIVEVRTVH